MALVPGEFGMGTDLWVEPIQIPNQRVENKTCYFQFSKGSPHYYACSVRTYASESVLLGHSGLQRQEWHIVG